MIGTGHVERYLTADEIRTLVHDALEALRPDGRRFLFIIPDGTRTMPMPQVFALIREMLGARGERASISWWRSAPTSR